MEYKLKNTIYHTTNVWKNSKGAFEFCVWAPFVRTMHVEIRRAKYPVFNPDVDLAEKWVKEWHIDSKTDDKKSIIFELKKGDDNCFRGSISGWRVKYGDMYRFILETRTGKSTAKIPEQSANRTYIRGQNCTITKSTAGQTTKKDGSKTKLIKNFRSKTRFCENYTISHI